MLSIGALAQIGQVTHRMVRHWDSAALLRARRAEVADEHRLAEARLRDVERRLRLIAGFEYAGDVPSGLEDVVLPEVATAFCGVHLGAMDTIFESWQSLHGEIVARGYTPNGPIRELYLRSEPAPQSDWVTELQQPVAPV